MSSAPPSKRRRVEIPSQVKTRICQETRRCPQAKISELILFAKKEFDLDIGKSTIGDILKQSEKWLNVETTASNRVRHSSGQHVKLEEALMMWFNNVRSNHACVSDDMLIEKAKHFGAEFNVTNFSYSRGWLQKFKNRHGIASKSLQGEASSANPLNVSQG